MSNDVSNPKLRSYSDALIGLETTINYVLEQAAMQGLNLKLESEIINQPHLPSRIHLRIVTPEMEVRNDLSTQARKVASRAVTGKASV